jgi:hypothetical protein
VVLVQFESFFSQPIKVSVFNALFDLIFSDFEYFILDLVELGLIFAVSAPFFPLWVL